MDNLDLLKFAFPEIFSFCAILVVILSGVLVRIINYAVLSIISLAGALVMVCLTFPPSNQILFNGFFVANQLTQFAKILILGGALGTLLLARQWLKDQKIYSLEFYALFLLAVLGMMVLVSAHHLLSMYVGLELMSLALYVLAAFETKRVTSSEAGLKYFITGDRKSVV